MEVKKLAGGALRIRTKTAIACTIKYWEASETPVTLVLSLDDAKKLYLRLKKIVE